MVKIIKQARIKMCGMTNQHDAHLAIELGVDAIGLIFYAKSARAIEIDTAQNIILNLPPFVSKVAVFVNPTEEEVRKVLEQVPVDLLQFHGKETDSFCNRFNKPYIKAIHMNEKITDFDWEDNYPNASAFLLDTYHEIQAGGTGEKFHWHELSPNLKKPIILAGGLTPENVAIAISIVKPYAVDVTTGVEAKKGTKDPTKMQNFIQNVRKFYKDDE